MVIHRSDRQKILLGTLVLGFLLTSPWGWAQGLSIYTCDDPPLQNLDPNYHVVGGVCVAIVQEIQDLIGDTSAIQGVPWARGYHDALTLPNVMLFSTIRSPQREASFRWVGPLFSIHSVLVAGKEFRGSLTSLDDAQKLKAIGVVRADTMTQVLRDKGFTNLEESTDYRGSIAKFQAGRVDAFTSTDVALAGHIHQAGLSPQDFRVIYSYSSFPVYLAFSLGTPPEVVKKWQEGFEQLQADGRLKVLLKTLNDSPDHSIE